MLNITTIANFNPFVPEIFDAEDVKLLFEGCSLQTFNKKDIIFFAGDENASIHYLKKGTVKHYVIHPSGKSIISSYAKEGSLLGITSISGDYTLPIYCVAATKCSLLKCSIGTFQDRLAQYNLERKFYERLCGLLSSSIYNHAIEDSDSKADLVYSLRRKGLTQQDIADLLHLSRGHISRICQQINNRPGSAKNK